MHILPDQAMFQAPPPPPSKGEIRKAVGAVLLFVAAGTAMGCRCVLAGGCSPVNRVRAAVRRRRSMSAVPEDTGGVDEIVWEDQWGCFRVHSASDDAPLLVTEMLHEAWGEVPLPWKLEFDDLEAARRWIACRLRWGHDRWYHRAGARAGVAG